MNRVVLAALCAGWVLSPVARAQSALRIALTPGPYVAGFRTIELWDSTRTFEIPATAREIAQPRPLAVSIWYPATASASASRMRFREYTELTSLPGRLPQRSPEGRAAARHLFALEVVRDSGRGQRELDALTSAVRDATPANGSFPIVVYGPGRDGLAFENSVITEYLASHGYIVLASPSWGAAGPMTGDFAGLESQARDMEFLIAYGRSLPHADRRQVAVMGESWGGMANILVAMRDASVRAVVSLDGSIAYWYNRRFKGGAFVEPNRLTAPVLFLKQGDPFPEMTPAQRAAYGADTLFTMFDELRYTDAYLVVLETVRHANFKSLSNQFPPYDSSTISFNADARVASAAYERECRFTVAFLDAYLRGSPTARAMLTDPPEAAGIPSHEVTIVRRTAHHPAPTVADFARTAAPRGLDHAPEVLADVRAQDSAYTLPEAQVDAWGTELLLAHRLAEAIGVFRVDTALYPNSASAALSLAQAYATLHTESGHTPDRAAIKP
jgi:dienelactone hydrolase